MIVEEKPNKIKEIVNELSVRHVAIIMDGNRRWAKKNMVPTAFGHQKGVSSFKNIVKACQKFGIEYLTVYAFSTENWNRKPEEVNFLMELFAKTIRNEMNELAANDVRVKFIGDLSKFNKHLREILLDTEKCTENNAGLKLQIAVNYGARLELTEAVKKIALLVKNNELNIEDINPEIISNSLYTVGMPDPDLLIRTGSEKRISNYLLWQIAYSEIYVTDELWPEFNENSLANAILEFKQRNRRFGQ